MNQTRLLLLVEDEKLIAHDEAATLRKNGYNVIIANNGEDAISILQSTTDISLVLMDIDLGDGIDGTETVRRILKFKELPVIFLTSHAEKEMVERVKNITRYGYVLKNSGEFVLIESIQMAYELFEARQSLLQEKKVSAENEANYRLLVENQTDLVVKVDMQGRFQFVSPSYCKMFGKSEKELLGTSFVPLIHEEDREPTLKAMEKLYEKPYTVYLEQRALTVSGWKWLGWTDTAVLNDVGEVIAVIGVGRDIGVQKQAETRAVEHEQKIRNILESSTNVYYSHTAEHVITYISPQVETVLGYTPNEARIKWTEFATDNPVNEQGLMHTLRAIKTGERQPPYELELRRKNSEIIWVEVREFPIRENGRTTAIVGSLNDITERKRADQKMKRMLDRNRDLLLELQHRVKNSFSMILGMIELMEKSAGERSSTEILSEMRAKITAVSDMYAMLYDAESISDIALDEYLAKLVDSFRTTTSLVDFSVSAGRVFIPVKNAVPLGLIVSELITNSIKHAFDGNKGMIFIDLIITEDIIELRYKDNGKGLPSSVDVDSSDSIGLSLFRALCAQIHAEYQIENKDGFVCRLSFPADKQNPIPSA